MGIKSNWQPNAEEIWMAERDRFIVLLHFYNCLDFGEGGCLQAASVMRDLGMSSPRADDLVKSLLKANFLDYARHSPGLAITPRGVDYIEIDRGRRRSVRLHDPSGPACPVAD